jgi:aspartate/methionine/tyrosine aminotransferase
MSDVVCKIIDNINKKHPIIPQDLNYTDWTGSPKLRAACASLFQKQIFAVDTVIEPDNIIMYNGAGALIEGVTAVICDEGEVVLIPAPMYLAFENDVNKRFGCKLVPVQMPYDTETNRFNLDLDVVQETLRSVREQGLVARCFLLCCPNNPSGDIYSRKHVEWLIEWCARENMHFISDEVYALSVFNNVNHDMFVSAGTIMLEGLQTNNSHKYEHVHIIYSFSKDFTLNGFRVGILYSRNKELLDTLRCNAYFQSVSTHTQALLTNLLAQEEILTKFQQENQKRLLHAYNQTKELLHEYGIKHVEARAGVFIWMDLSPWMKKKLNVNELTCELELIAWKRMVDEAKVYIPVGQFFKCSTPGWCRLCFTSSSLETMRSAFDRLLIWVNN